MEKIPIRHIYTFQKEPDFSESFSIRNIKILLEDDDMVQELHRHDFFYILVLEKGMGSHEIDFISYTIGNHSVFFMRPGQVHQLILKAGSSGYLIQFSTDFYSPQDNVFNTLRKASSINHRKVKAHRFQKLLLQLDYAFQEYTNKEEHYLEVIKMNLSAFFIELIRQQSNSPSDITNLYTQERLDAFLQLLETHLYHHKEVTYYTEKLNLSTYQLTAITKTTLGKTCSELINEQILLEAKRYLLATSNQINQIADNLGYDDVSYFIRFFKKHTGFSPEVFRQNFK